MIQCEAKKAEVTGAGQSNDVKRDVVKIKESGVHQCAECAAASNSSIEEAETTKFLALDVGVNPSENEVVKDQEESCKNLSAASEFVSGDEIGVHKEAIQMFLDMDEFTPSSQNSSIVEQILGKYGDITAGSILKSAAAKSTFLQLVADVVHRLCNHTLGTLGPEELLLIQSRIDDALAVGFHVGWLQQRVNKVITASNYQVCMIELNELGQQIVATKKSLVEMELRQMVLKKQEASMKAAMEENNLRGSNLGDGLL